MLLAYLILLIFFFGYGSYLRYLAPREIGHITGFRSLKSIQSQDNWDQANYQFGGWLQQSGVITAILFILTRLTPLKDVRWNTDMLLLIPIALVILAIFQVNQELPD